MARFAFETALPSALALLTLVACGTSNNPASGDGGTGGAGASGGIGAVTGGSGGAVATGGTVGNGGSSIIPVPDAGAPDETLCGDIELTQTRVVPAGTTLAICAGATIRASAGVSLTVEGTLVSDGTSASPVTIVGATAGAGAWTGLIVQSGGAAIIHYTQIRDASVALVTRAGSSYAIDHLVISNSAHLANLESGGTIAHSEWHALGAAQSGVVIQITDASPEFTDTLIDNSNQSTDMVHVTGATSAASFDHVEISDAHCALHFATGTNCSITNSYFHDLQYGLMVLASNGTSISHNNFQANVRNIGTCSGGTATVTGNYFDDAAFDGSCSSLTSTGAASAPFTDVGPRP
jgi:hypothetical protein